jgi:hypothetical protein
MMVDGAEEGQLKGQIDVLAPYTSSAVSSRTVAATTGVRSNRAHRSFRRSVRAVP